MSARQSCAAEPARVKGMAKMVLTLQQQGVDTVKGLPFSPMRKGQRTGNDQSDRGAKNMIQGKRCVVLGKRSSAYWLKKILDRSFAEVELVENQVELNRLAKEPPTLALLVTDSFPGGIPLQLLRELKARLTPKLIICLADTLDSATEVELRSLGICFLGSYVTFIKNSEQIFGKATADARYGAALASPPTAPQATGGKPPQDTGDKPPQPGETYLPHILLVDDEPAFLSSMTRLLRNSPCRLQTASNADEALAITLSTPVDLLITDYLMPGRNGLELIFAVHRQSPETGLVMLTAVEEIAKAKVEIEEMAIFDLYFKPLTTETLTTILTGYLEHPVTHAKPL